MAVSEVPPAEETLAWEAENRSRAGSAAIAAGALLFGTFLFAIFGFSGAPNVVLTDGMRDLLSQPLGDGRKGLLTAKAMWYADHAVLLILVTLLTTIGTMLIAMVLGYLYRATDARRPSKGRFLLFLALIGPILYGLGPLISVVTVALQSRSYVADGVFSTVGAHEAVGSGTGIVVAQVFVGIGQLATAAAVGFISYFAMQVGLLTRFLGILGVIVGGLLILPAFFGPPAIIQSFWLVALGLMILGRSRVVPPAWAEARAIPWPSRQQLAESGSDPGVPRPASAASAEDEASPGSPSAAPARRKRKRR